MTVKTLNERSVIWKLSSATRTSPSQQLAQLAATPVFSGEKIPGGVTLSTSHSSQASNAVSISANRSTISGSMWRSQNLVDEAGSFQERALSRRILHFTSTQLYWECGSDVRGEALSKFNK